jgi:rRNA-processing protein FCF1
VEAHRRRNHEGISQGNSPRAVILDSNFLFVPQSFGVDIFEELKKLLGNNVEFLVTRSSIQELEVLRTRAKPSFRKEIDFALRLADRCKVIEDEPWHEESVDSSILKAAKKMKLPVATNDAKLRRRLKKGRVTVIYLRQGSFLEINGPTW